MDSLVSALRFTIRSTPSFKKRLMYYSIIHKAFSMTLRRLYFGQACKILWDYIIRKLHKYQE